MCEKCVPFERNRNGRAAIEIMKPSPQAQPISVRSLSSDPYSIARRILEKTTIFIEQILGKKQ